MTKITHKNVFQQLETWAPKSFAYDWDNVGLQVGSTKDETTGILVTLDVTEAIVDEALNVGANLIVAHHPMLFKALKQIDVDSVKGKLIQKLIKHDITVYASHEPRYCRGRGKRFIERSNRFKGDKTPYSYPSRFPC